MTVIEAGGLLGGRYQLGAVIGRGGMAEVREGHDTRLDRPVAVKLLRPELDHQPGVRERFESEAKLAARLIHPNIVAVFDSGEADGRAFIVMERLPGRTLHEVMTAGRLAADEACRLALEVLAALQAAHEAGIVHRDVKPANVLVAGSGRWKVADFGIAKALEVGGGADLTAAGLLIGTPAYLAPERFTGSPATVASDLYAVGVVLYEAMAGRKPFAADRPEAWAAVVAGAPPTPLADLRPDADPALVAAVERALAKDPADLFWSAAAMAAAVSGGVPGGAAVWGRGLASGMGLPEQEATVRMWGAPVGSGRAGGSGGSGGSGTFPSGGGRSPSRGGGSGGSPSSRVGSGPTRLAMVPDTVADTEVFSGAPGVDPTDVLTLARPGDPLSRMGVSSRVVAAIAAAVLVILVVLLALAASGHPSSGSGTTPVTTAPAAPNLSPGLNRALQNLEKSVQR